MITRALFCSVQTKNYPLLSRMVFATFAGSEEFMMLLPTMRYFVPALRCMRIPSLNSYSWRIYCRARRFFLAFCNYFWICCTNYDAVHFCIRCPVLEMRKFVQSVSLSKPPSAVLVRLYGFNQILFFKFRPQHVQKD